MFHAIQLWLSAQPLAAIVRDTVWVKALLESAHILADGLLLFSAAMICARLMGLAAKTTSVPELTRRFAPWIWAAFAVAVITGGILLTGAGRRGLDNPMFKVKLAAMICAVAATACIQLATRLRPALWDAGWPRRLVAPIIGVACIMLWLTTVFAGRLLAYSSAFFPQN